MLTIIIPAVESFDQTTSRFIETPEVTIELEHSLASLSKWEETYEKPFLGHEKHTQAEIIGYIKAMCITPNVPDSVFAMLSGANYEAINAYINKKMTATWFTDSQQPGRAREIVTAEVVYFWMSHYQIPFEAEHWHFNKLMTLIRVANSKNQSGKSDKTNRMGKAELLARRRAMNEQRKNQWATKG